jgi:hypothetical protein
MVEPNPLVINSLPSGQKATGGIYAYLISLDNKYRWDFLYNPEEISFAQKANYAEVPTALTILPDQQYLYTSGKTHNFTDLLLVTECEGLALKVHIDKLFKTLYPDIPNKIYEPPTLNFIWGNYNFGFCKLLEINGKNRLTLSGEMCDVRLSFTLVECPTPALAARSTDNLPDRTQQTQPEIKTTTRVSNQSLEIRAAKQAVLNSQTFLRYQTLKYSYNASQSRVDIFNERNQLVATYKASQLNVVSTAR